MTGNQLKLLLCCVRCGIEWILREVPFSLAEFELILRHEQREDDITVILRGFQWQLLLRFTCKTM